MTPSPVDPQPGGRPSGYRLPLSLGFLFCLAPLVSCWHLAVDSYLFLHTDLSRGQTIGRDFAVFWSASVETWRGNALAVFDPARQQAALEQLMGHDLAFMPFPYPPYALLIFLPLAALPYLPALISWLSLTFGAMGLALWRHLPPRRSLLLLALALSPASMVNLVSGQNGFLSAALLCGGLLSLERRPLLAGLLIGLLSYKPQLGLLLPFLLIAGGYWRAFWMAGATVILLAAISLLFPGSSAWHLYLTEVSPQQMHLAQFGEGIFRSMIPSYFMAGRALGFDLSIAWAMQIAASLAIAAAAIWAFRQKAPFHLKCAIAMVAAFLASPYVFTYDMPIVCVAILLAGRSAISGSTERLIFGLAWLYPALTIYSPVPIGAPILTALLVVLLHRLRQEARGIVSARAGHHSSI